MSKTIDIEALLETVLDTDVGASDSFVPSQPAGDLEKRRDAMLAELDRLTLGETVGVGGRGIIRRADQMGLRRDVAVKTVRGEPTPEAVVELLQEALITGSLEHPNIVPVHDIRLGDDGQPFIVLKKIEGRSWDEVMGSESLDGNLKILLEVIDAIRFAHSRQIVHRDLKPANVMVGEFGEVYVLDWGLAASLDDEADWLPRVSQLEGIAGTLGYMAPEMLTSTGITERTDVYLLGAILAEIATGKPPHQGKGMSELVDAIVDSRPTLDGVPSELAAIIRRAMAAAPLDRFESATELKEAIELFLVHREATRLTDGAIARLEELLAACEADEPDHDRLYNLFGECRFGFREALRRWPENAAASEGLRRAVEAMIGQELERKEAVAASRLLSELPDASEALRERVTAALEQEQTKRASFEKLEVDLDPATGSGTRIVAALALGLVATAAMISVPLVSSEMMVNPTWKRFFITCMVAGACLGAVAWVVRRNLTASLHNRMFALVIAGAWVATTVTITGQWIADSDPQLMASFHPIIWLSLMCVLVGALDLRLWPSMLLMVADGLVLPSMKMPYTTALLVVTLVVMVLNLWFVARRPRPPAIE